MRILIFNWRDTKHPLSGGAEIMLKQHALYWKKSGATVVWFSSSFPNAKNKEIIDGITIIRRGSHYTVHLFGFFYLLLGKLERPDVIVDCFHFIPFFTPLIFSNKKIIALIHEIAGKVWFRNAQFPISVIGYFLEPFTFKLYRKVPFITVSNSTKNELVKFGMQEKNIHVIFNGIDEDNTQKNVKKEINPTFVFLGRISNDKGIKDAIRAFSQVLREVPNATLWIIGKEEKSGELKKIIDSEFAGATDSIKYWGYVSEKVKYRLLQKAWILIHPSQKEGWGLTVIEAARCGTPTVGYDVEGLRDSIVNNKTGFLVGETPDELSRSILDLILNKKKLFEMSVSCRDWATKFSWEKSTKESWRLIKSI